MAYAQKIGDAWLELSGAFKVGEGDDAFQYAPNWPELASAEERTAIGIAQIVEPDQPAASDRVTGSEVVEVDGRPQRRFIFAPFDLDGFRTEMTDRMNEDAGGFRRRFITDITGQQATYLAKETEAKAWTADADMTDFPYLSNEAAETGTSVAAIVALVLATADQWRALDPKIEGRRRGACVAIAAAPDAESIILAATVDWNALLAG